MPRPKRVGKQYDSFHDKIVDYQLKRAQWLLKDWTRGKSKKDFEEYDALAHLKSGIKEKIENHLDAMLDFSLIMQHGFLSTKDQPYLRSRQISQKKSVDEPLISDPKLADYHKIVNKEEDGVRKKLEEEHMEFVGDVFTRERIKKLLSSIFFRSYKMSIKKDHESYRIAIAALMLERSVWELTHYLPRHSEFLSKDLNRATEISHFILKQFANEEPIWR